MMKRFLALVTLSIFCACALADVSHVLQTTHEPPPPPAGPPQPYVFSYQAGRAPGHVDRQHTEVSDGSGVIRGAFSYIDPKNQLRTVQYTADENGFHPELSHKLEDSEAVKRAKEKHFALYNRIAQEHAQAAAAAPQQQQQEQQYYAEPQQHYAQAQQQQQYNHYHHQAVAAAAPEQSEAVIRATNQHLSQFERIAAEHAAIGRRQEAERQALLAQHAQEHNSHEDGQYHPENEHY